MEVRIWWPSFRSRVAGELWRSVHEETANAIRLLPVCDRISSKELTTKAEGASAFPDAYPVSEGHALVVPDRHEPNFFALPEAEQAAVWRLVALTHAELARSHAPAGFNIGLNIGDAAGQTVGHAHVHVIPRYTSDMPDPRGGIRWVLPAKAAYWS